jgi:hypothetical protein
MEEREVSTLAEFYAWKAALRQHFDYAGEGSVLAEILELILSED